MNKSVHVTLQLMVQLNHISGIGEWRKTRYCGAPVYGSLTILEPVGKCGHKENVAED